MNPPPSAAAEFWRSGSDRLVSRRPSQARDRKKLFVANVKGHGSVGPKKEAARQGP